MVQMKEHGNSKTIKKFVDSGVPLKFENVYLDTIEQDLGIKLSIGQERTVEAFHDLLEEVKKNPQDRSTSKLIVVIGGSTGIGKTMLASALCNYYNSFRQDDRWQIAEYITLRKLEGEVKSAMRSKDSSDAEVIQEYCVQKLLVIDEIYPKMTDYQKQVLNEIIVEREANLKPIILIGNINQAQFDGMFEEHILSRLRQGRMLFGRGEDRRREN